MGLYTYKAKDAKGNTQKGKMEAADRREVAVRLKEEGLYLFEAVEENGADPSKMQQGKVKLKSLVTFCRQLSTTLSSGIVLLRAMEIIYHSTTNKKMKGAVIHLYEGVQKGESLSEAMEGLGNTFPDLLINMVRTGEASGTLDEIMMRMSEHYENEMKLSNKIKTSMIYPIILSITAIVVVIFMLVGVLPKFMDMFAGMQLPMPTKILVGLSNLVQTKWYLLLIGLILLVAGVKYLLAFDAVRYKIDRMFLHLPVIGKLARTVYTSRFASTFGILYSSGIGILTCIEISARVLKNLYIRAKLKEALERVQRGDMLSVALRDTQVFDIIFTAMVLTGEEAGTLDDMLKKTGDYFQDEANTAMSKLVSMLEPVMIILLGLVVGFIVIAIMLPIFTMYSQIM